MRQFDEPAPQRPITRGELCRVFDAAGDQKALFRLRARSVTAFDRRGIHLGEAHALPDRVVVRNRLAQVVLVVRPVESEDGTAESTTAVASLEDGDGVTLGRVETEADGHLRLLSPEGFQRGEIRPVLPDPAAQEGSGGVEEDGERAETVEVYGAPGTDLLARVRRAEPTEIQLVNPTGEVMGRLQTRRLEPYKAAVLILESPLQGVDHGDRLFQAGLLAYLQKREYARMVASPDPE